MRDHVGNRYRFRVVRLRRAGRTNATEMMESEEGVPWKKMMAMMDNTITAYRISSMVISLELKVRFVLWYE